MATYARLRRVLTASSSFLHHRPSTSPLLQTPKLQSSTPSPSRLFTSTTPSPPSSEIGPDTTLFEGCDYNHWLVVIDFPRDQKPSPQRMVKFYEDTASKIFASSEEAKKRIYACSTTTYTGFQVECSEETSEKFKDLPGVVLVLPDSYIDPVNKEYGGDKYINGHIIPRPPPIQYGRSGPNRDFRSRPSLRAPAEGANRNYGPPVTPQQNFSPPPPSPRNFDGGNRNYGPPVAPQQNFSTPPPANQNFGPSPSRPQQSFDPSPLQHNYGPPHAQQQHGPPQNYGPPPQQCSDS